jgi:RecA/RadA recombinase
MIDEYDLALRLLNEKQLLRVGCYSVDDCLNGGIDVGGITEICGESGSGKTQFCFQLCCSVQLPVAFGGLDGSAVYICTESQIPTERLREIANGITKKQEKFEIDWDLCDNIFVKQSTSCEILLKDLETLPALIEKKSVKLIVVDSIAAILRSEFDSDNIVERNDFVFEICLVLKVEVMCYLII